MKNTAITNRLKVCILGLSNVGKSKFINIYKENKNINNYEYSKTLENKNIEIRKTINDHLYILNLIDTPSNLGIIDIDYLIQECDTFILIHRDNYIKDIKYITKILRRIIITKKTLINTYIIINKENNYKEDDDNIITKISKYNNKIDNLTQKNNYYEYDSFTIDNIDILFKNIIDTDINIKKRKIINNKDSDMTYRSRYCCY